MRRLLLIPLLFSGCEPQAAPPAAGNVVGSTPSSAVSDVGGKTTVPAKPPDTTGRLGIVAPYNLAHIRVTVRKVSIGKVPLKQLDGSIAFADAPRLMIAVKIDNTSDKRQSPYNTWVPDLDAAKTFATLIDNVGAEYKRVTFGFGNNVKDRTVLDTLTPGKSIVDLLVFQVPLSDVKYLDLDLPGANCGVRGVFQFRIVAADWAGSTNK